MPLTARLFNGQEREWDDFVDSHPDATGYHRLAWREVIERSFGHRTYYLSVANNGRGEVEGVLPLVYMRSGLFGRFLVSLPFLNYGGVIAGSHDASRLLIAEAEAILDGLGASHLELRNLKPLQEEMVTREHKVTMILPLAEDPETQWKGFNAKLRNQIRKAEKSGLACSNGGVENIDHFYRIFARNMRDLGTPVYCREFFANVLAAFPESTTIFLIRHQQRIIAAAFAIWYRETLEIPWAASLREFRPLCPNNLLYWRAIQFAIENGFKQFDFGRSSKGEGTYRFKEQWGAKGVQLYWQYLVSKGKSVPEFDPRSPRYRLAVRIWQRLPLVIANMLGPSVVRNIP